MNRNPNTPSETATINASTLSSIVGKGWIKCPACNGQSKAKANRHTDKQGKLSYQLLCHAPKCIAYKERQGNGRGKGYWIDSAESIEAPAKASKQPDTEKRQAIAAKVWNEAEAIRAKWIKQHTAEAKRLQWALFTELTKRLGSEALALLAMSIMEGMGIRVGYVQAKARGRYQGFASIIEQTCLQGKAIHATLIDKPRPDRKSQKHGSPAEAIFSMHHCEHAKYVIATEGLIKALAAILIFGDQVSVINAPDMGSMPKAVAYAAKHAPWLTPIAWCDNDGNSEAMEAMLAKCRKANPKCLHTSNASNDEALPYKAIDDLLLAKGITEATRIASACFLQATPIGGEARTKQADYTETIDRYTYQEHADHTDYANVIELYPVTPDYIDSSEADYAGVIDRYTYQASEADRYADHADTHGLHIAKQPEAKRLDSVTRSEKTPKQARDGLQDLLPNAKGSMLIKAPAGIGKTEAIIEQLRPRIDQARQESKAKHEKAIAKRKKGAKRAVLKHIIAIYAVPTIDVAKEIEARIKKADPSLQTFGYKGRDQFTDNGIRLCKLKETPEGQKATGALERIGIINKALCKGSEGYAPACPHAASCGYLQRLEALPLAKPDVVLAPHAVLYHAPEQLTDYDTRLLVIDETVDLAHATRKRTIDISPEGIMQATPDNSEGHPSITPREAAQFSREILEGTLTHKDEYTLAWLELLAGAEFESEGIAKAIFTEANKLASVIGSEADLAKCFKGITEAANQQSQRYKAETMLSVIKHVLNDKAVGKKERLQDVATVEIDATLKTLTYRDWKPFSKDLITNKTQIIGIDATPLITQGKPIAFTRMVSRRNVMLKNMEAPQKYRKVDYFEIDCDDNTVTIQANAPFGDKEGFANMALTETSNRPIYAGVTIAEGLARKLISEGKMPAIFTHKEAREALDSRIPVIMHGHYGKDNKATNDFEYCDSVILLGSQKFHAVNSRELQSLAALLSNPWDKRPPDIRPKKSRVVTRSIDGSEGVKWDIDYHDTLMNEIAIWQRESHAIQAIARIRAINSNERLPVFILCDHALHSIPIDTHHAYESIAKQAIEALACHALRQETLQVSCMKSSTLAKSPYLIDRGITEGDLANVWQGKIGDLAHPYKKHGTASALPFIPSNRIGRPTEKQDWIVSIDTTPERMASITSYSAGTVTPQALDLLAFAAKRRQESEAKHAELMERIRQEAITPPLPLPPIGLQIYNAPEGDCFVSYPKGACLRYTELDGMTVATMTVSDMLDIASASLTHRTAITQANAPPIESEQQSRNLERAWDYLEGRAITQANSPPIESEAVDIWQGRREVIDALEALSRAA